MKVEIDCSMSSGDLVAVHDNCGSDLLFVEVRESGRRSDVALDVAGAEKLAKVLIEFLRSQAPVQPESCTRCEPNEGCNAS